MNDAFVIIGRVARPHGVSGEVLVESLSDFPERFAELARVTLVEETEVPPASPRELRVEAVRLNPRGAIMKFAGVSSPEEAAALRGRLLGVPREEAVPLAPGEYYAFQLVGLRVVTTAGASLGTLRDVLRYPANDVYEVWDAERSREILLPATAEVVREVDLERGVMVVELLEGLGE